MTTDGTEFDASLSGGPFHINGGQFTPHPSGLHSRRPAREIEQWFVDYLANLQNIPPDTIDVTVPFESFALGSIEAVGMTGDLEEWLGRSVDPTMVYDYPTIEQFSQYLAEQDGI